MNDEIFWIYNQPMTTYYFRGHGYNICRVCLRTTNMFSVPHVRIGSEQSFMGTDADHLIFESRVNFHLRNKVKFYKL